ncbi:MAG: hypothetical protein DRN88_06005 [Candidatus Hydrothermarchaeota archaeon]|nr:MAG: hypothetical protein DRN88_06005 [Candidatus Hydrothermarchaeota archaeon]
MKLSEILDEARLLYFVEIGDDHRFERSLNLIPLVLGKNSSRGLPTCFGIEDFWFTFGRANTSPAF